MKTKWKYILAGLTGFILLVITIFNLGRGLEAEVLEVKPQTIANTFQEEGTVIPQLEMPIYALNTQKVLDLPITEGQEVKKGDILAVLDTTELEIQLKGLQGQLVRAQGEKTQALLEQYKTQVTDLELQLQKARLELATQENNLYRAQQLFEAGALTKVEWEEAIKAKDLAEISVIQQEQALKTLKNLQQFRGCYSTLYWLSNGH